MGCTKKKTAYLLRQTVSVGTLIFWKMPLILYKSPSVAVALCSMSCSPIDS